MGRFTPLLAPWLNSLCLWIWILSDTPARNHSQLSCSLCMCNWNLTFACVINFLCSPLDTCICTNLASPGFPSHLRGGHATCLWGCVSSGCCCFEHIASHSKYSQRIPLAVVCNLFSKTTKTKYVSRVLERIMLVFFCFPSKLQVYFDLLLQT